MYGPVSCHKSMWSDHPHGQQQSISQLPLRSSNPTASTVVSRRLMHQRTAGPILLDSPFPSARHHHRGSYPAQFHRSHSDLPGGNVDDRLRCQPRTLRQYIPVLWGWLAPTRPAAVKLRELAASWTQAISDPSVYDALLAAEAATAQPLRTLRAVKNYELTASREAASGASSTDLQQHRLGMKRLSRQFLGRSRLCKCRGSTPSSPSMKGGEPYYCTAPVDDEDYCPSCGGENLHTARTACTSRSNSVRRALPCHPIAAALYEFREAKSTTIESAPQSRESIIYWMARVIETMGWPISAFFTAVHAFDVAMASGIMPKAEYIPRISTSCVLIGVCSECDYKQMTKARWFVNQVPHVNNVRDLVISQMYIVSYLKGGSLMHKTPVDLIMIYLAAIDRFAPKFETMTGMRMSIWDVGIRLSTHNLAGSMLEYIISPAAEEVPHSGLIPLAETIVDLLLCVSVFCFINMTYPVLEMSRLLATIMLDIFMATHPAFYRYEFAQVFVKTAFRLDLMDEIFPLWRDLNTLYQACKADSLQIQAAAGQRRFPGWSPRSVALIDHLLSLPREFPIKPAAGGGGGETPLS